MAYIENNIVVHVSSLFDTTIKMLYSNYRKSDILNKNISEIFKYDDEYALIIIGNYRLYTKYMLINNIFVLIYTYSDIIDSKYFIHTTLTPLTNIIELTKILENTPVTAKQREYISIIKKNNLELTKNINDITNFLNYFNKGIVLYKESINLHNKISYVKEMISGTSIQIDIGHQVIYHDDNILFDILYHFLSQLNKNFGNNNIKVLYEKNTIIFISDMFNGNYIRMLEECSISKYKYNADLDLHTVKLLLKLTEIRLEYTDNKYILNLV
jgi:hypothetical protein